jgi:hypothetical protein
LLGDVDAGDLDGYGHLDTDTPSLDNDAEQPTNSEDEEE